MRAKLQIPKSIDDRVVYVLLSVVVLVGAALVFLSTSQGLGVGGDATIYMTSARNLAEGRGLGLFEADGSFRLLPYSAPFFPIVLAIFENNGSSTIQVARILNTWLFAALIFLAGISARITTRSRLMIVGSALLVAFSPILMPVFSWAMAEPLTLVLGFSGLFAMALMIEYPDSRELLAAAALLTGLAFLTRYSAAAFVAASGLGWLIFANVSWKSKLIRGAAFGAIALLPMLVWMLIQLSYTSGVASRTMEDISGMSSRLASFWPQAGEVLLNWLIPASWIEMPFYPRLLNTVLILVLILVLGWLAVKFFFRPLKQTENRSLGFTWPVLIGMFILLYLAEIFVVYLATYPPITLDNRMFSPVHVGVLLLVPIFLDHLFANHQKTFWRFASAAIVFAFAAWYGWRDIRIVNQNSAEGLGYNSRAWRSSELVAWVKAAPVETQIVTNETMALLYLTGKTAYPLAEIYADRPGSLDDRYGVSDADPGQAVFAKGEAALVLFESISVQFESIYGERTQDRVEALTAGLEQVFEGDDGAVFLAP